MASRTEQSNTSREAGNAPRFRYRYCLYLVVLLLLTLAVVSFSPADSAALAGGTDAPPKNWIGVSGAFFAEKVFYLIGLAGYLLLGLLWLRAVRGFFPEPMRRKWFLLGGLLLIPGTALLLAIAPQSFADLTDSLGIGRAEVGEQAIPGGVFGQWLAAPGVKSLGLGEGFLRKWIGVVGVSIVGWALLSAGAVMVFLSDWLKLCLHLVGNAGSGRSVAPQSVPPPAAESAPEERPGLFANARAALAALHARQNAPVEDDPTPSPVSPVVSSPAPAPPPASPVVSSPAPVAAPVFTPVAPPPPPPPTEKPPLVAVRNAAEPNTRVTEKGVAADAGNSIAFVLPPISMLGKGADATGEDLDSIIARREILQRTLDSFRIEGQVTNHISGPRITRYEITLSPGVKTSKVESIADNIAMDLEAKSIRVLAPIPGRNAVGVEAPNSKSEAVFMRSMLEADAWQKSKAEIPIVLGKNVAGVPVILDLAKAPHLLIAGSTGSGKSVCMNTLIMSMLFKFTPEELRLIMVDPKVVEFAGYQTLPHLVTPVINDSKKVPIALRWAVNEMEKRYRILARAGVKKLREFNDLPLRDEPLLDDDGLPIPPKMPILVVIVDELADLMMTDARKDAETSIARIAQKGRAAGIHIVIATQRPSRDVITGVIKANLPTKIAFMVGSGIDSRVILDQNGAEALLGQGDMLFLPPGTPALERIQGAWVHDDDIKKVVDFVSAQAPQKFDRQVVAEEEAESDDLPDPDDEYDAEDAADVAPLIKKYLQPGDSENLRKALEIVLLENKASTSYLQRRMGIGYNRAAELIDQMEARGIVGPPGPGGSKREILIFDEIEG